MNALALFEVVKEIALGNPAASVSIVLRLALAKSLVVGFLLEAAISPDSYYLPLALDRLDCVIGVGVVSFVQVRRCQPHMVAGEEYGRVEEVVNDGHGLDSRDTALAHQDGRTPRHHGHHSTCRLKSAFASW